MLFTNMKSLNAFQMTRKSSNVLGWSWGVIISHCALVWLNGTS